MTIKSKGAKPPSVRVRSVVDQDLLEHAPVGLFLTDNQGNCTFVNKAWLEIAGMSFQQALGVGWQMALHPEDREKIFFEWNEAAKRKATFSLQYRFKNISSGKVTWVLGRAQAIPEEDNTSGFVGTVVDISAHKIDQAQLLRANTFLDMIIENIPNMIFIKEARELRFVRFNRAGEELVGAPRENLINKNDFDLFPHDQATSFTEIDRAVLESGTPLLIPEEPIDTAKKERRYLRTRKIPLKVPDLGNEYLLGISEDITAEKKARDALVESEARFRKMADSAPILMWICDSTGQCTYFNRGWLEFTGRPLEQELGLGWTAGIHPADKVSYETCFKTALTARLPFTTEFRLLRHDCEHRWIRAQAAPLHRLNGEFDGYIGSCFDQTDSKMAAEKLEKARLAAEETTKLKSQFLANMSHEIRTPMNGIIGMGELLINSGLSSEQQEYAETILSSANSLLSIINDILDSSKIEARKLELSPAPFDLRNLVAKLSKAFTFVCREKLIRLNIEIADSVPKILIGDETRIRQIITNLLGNAVKFTPANGSITIRVDSTVSDPQTQRIQIAVQDSGIGIPPEKQKAIFDPFSQADPSITRHFGGTGLGLSIVKQLVELMRGSISVSSVVGVGSTFVCTLPLSIGKESVHETPLSSAPTAQLHGLKVLLAEDNLVNQKVARAVLEKAGCAVKVVADGKAAYELRKGAQFDVILMDVQMPIMDGMSATQEIRAWERQQGKIPVPIVAMTAHAMSGDKERFLEAGMNDHVSKPFDRQSLLNKLSAYTARK